MAAISPPPASREQQLRQLIRRRYARTAREGAPAADGMERALAAGYASDELARFPAEVVAAWCGCGYGLDAVDLTGVRVVVELGCGAGLDACLAAERLGVAGRVVALDLTLPMLERVLQAKAALPGAAVHPLAGELERLPIRDGAADLVLANAAFNLALDVNRALAEAARILRPGGRLICRELVRGGALPPELAQDPLGWNTSLGGVLEEAALRVAVRAAGLERVRITGHRPFPPVVAVRLEASKPED